MAESTQLFEGAKHASAYLKFRPALPQSVFERFIEYTQEKLSSKHLKLAVDVGCGSGQSTRPLASYFEKVIGIDVSKAQIVAAQCAENPPNVEYRIGREEKIPVADASASLVTCCQAVHWFDFGLFCQEVDRILHPSGCIAIAAHGYCLPETLDGDKVKDKQIQELKWKFYSETLAPYWSTRLEHVNKLYTSFTIPYAENIRDDSFQMVQEVSIADYVGFLSSWSAVQCYKEKNPDKPDPTEEFKARLAEILGAPAPVEDFKMRYTAPIVILLGRKPGAVEDSAVES